MPADISFTPGADGAIIAEIAPGLPASARRLLEQHDAVRGESGTYTFAGSDAVARAARAALLLNTGGLRVDTFTGPLEPPVPAPVDGVDVIFARHPTEGIVAATTSDATEGLVPDVLRKFGFTHDGSAPDRDIYLQPAVADERQALVAAARASMVLQTLGLQVATRGLATPPASADRLAEAAEDLAVEQVNIRTLTDSRDIADLLDAAVDGHTGALPQLSGLLDDIKEWAGALPDGQDQQIRARIDEARTATEALLANVTGLQRDLTVLGAVVDAPVTSLRSTRSTAATAATAHAVTGGPILQAAGPARTTAFVPQPVANHAASL
ncbi:hypothetical protein ACFVUH_08470 [Kitasatospora sp. NPDC058032]|uniref:hypothetical protein n=1 Tax=Kitasatospora sp. NPDC058032 TaxID=3346307 RepID=UPI0036D827FA